MGYFFHCYTSTLWEHKLPLPCSVLWSENHMIIKACCRTITDYATTPLYNEKINLKNWHAFLSRPTLVPWLRKVGWSSYFPRRCCFTHSPLMFPTQSLIYYYRLRFVFVWPMSVNTWYWFNPKFSTDSESYLMGILKRKSWVNIVKYWFFY